MSYTPHDHRVFGYCYRKQALLWAEGDSCRAREISKLQFGSEKGMKAEKIAKAEKLEKEAWLEKMERQEKLQQGGMRAMDPLEAHMLSKITAGVTMIMSSKRKELMADEVRASFNMGIIHRESVNMSVFGVYKKNWHKGLFFSPRLCIACVYYSSTM